MVFMEELRSLKLKIGAPVPEPVLPALGEAKPPELPVVAPKMVATPVSMPKASEPVQDSILSKIFKAKLCIYGAPSRAKADRLDFRPCRQRSTRYSGAAADRQTIDDASAPMRSAPVIPTSSPNELKGLTKDPAHYSQIPVVLTF